MRNILKKEKLKDKSPRGRELRGQGNFEWSTDFVEKKNLENYTRQVAQDLFIGEAQHEPRGAHLDGLRTQSLASKRGLRILDGTNCDD